VAPAVREAPARAVLAALAEAPEKRVLELGTAPGAAAPAAGSLLAHWAQVRAPLEVVPAA
jgi:hypothetical protein